jgi:hypothetical protein
MKAFLRMAVILAVPVCLALGSVEASADATSADISILGTAELLPDGSALLTVDYICQPGFSGDGSSLFTELEQPSAFGLSGAVAMTCDDQHHKATFDNAPGPFAPGSASALAFVRNLSGSSSAVAEAEVTIQ